jgi:hypothetical protein
MGCYDSIFLPCPKCGELYEAQSKSGDCLLRVYDFKYTPKDVMENVNRHAPFTCFNCGTIFKVEFNPEIKIVETDEIANDFPDLPKNASVKDFEKAFLDYRSKIDKK